jgi:hypothetical protein
VQLARIARPPGGMRVFGEGWRVALRVRLLHTLIRRAVFINARWDTERLGMPINQVGLLGAPLSSSLMLGKFTKVLGFRTTDAEIEAMMHLWRYVAYVMGYCSPHFPTTVEEGLQAVFNAFNLSPLSEHPDGIRLGKSFLAACKPTGMRAGRDKRLRWREYRANIAMTLFFVLPETRRLIEAPDPRFWAAAYWLTHAPSHFIEDTRRRWSDAYAARLDERMSERRHAWVARQLGEADLVYRPQSKF